MKKIDKKIINYKVIDKEGSEDEIKLEELHEKMKRPEVLLGSTYKIKTPNSEHALYITINDVVLNKNTEHEQRRPYEVFINSKNMEHFQWVIALTRVISAVFRKGGDICFLVEELKVVFDPKGGYFKKGGIFMPSLVAEIGFAIENHMKSIGFITNDVLTEEQKEFIRQKRKEYEEKHSVNANKESFPDSSTLCSKCNTKAVILMDGCKTCLNCGDSKCG